MSFAEQREKLRKALIGAGLPVDSATLIANILGNSAQSMHHAGQQTLDTTPRDLRQVTADQRKHRFPNLDPLHADHDHRKPRGEASEQRKERVPEPNVKSSAPPQVLDATFNIVPGAFTDVAGDGETAQVSVNSRIEGRPPGGMPIAMLDVPGNEVVGKAARPEVGPPDGSARFNIRENAREVVWNLELTNRSEYDVVTGVEFVPEQGLRVTYSKLRAWDLGKQRTDIIKSVEQPVVTELVTDKNGAYGERRRISTFSSIGIDRSFLNVYRIGKFTGKWDLDEEKEIEQVFPESDTKVKVTNLTHPSPATPEGEDHEKYVLFAPRIKDKVTPIPEEGDAPADARNDRPHPVDAEGNKLPKPRVDVFGNPKYPPNEPEMKYYVIEIQDAKECYAFSSLTGKLTSDLQGYMPYQLQAIVHCPVDGSDPSCGAPENPDDPPCLQWKSDKLTVLTDASLSGDGLTFERKEIVVLSKTDATPLVIPVSTCPPPEGGGGGGGGY